MHKRMVKSVKVVSELELDLSTVMKLEELQPVHVGDVYTRDGWVDGQPMVAPEART